jgi:hypothetical protein
MSDSQTAGRDVTLGANIFCFRYKHVQCRHIISLFTQFNTKILILEYLVRRCVGEKKTGTTNSVTFRYIGGGGEAIRFQLLQKFGEFIQSLLLTVHKFHYTHLIEKATMM